MPPLRVLIVDDEPLARDRLRAWLRAEPDVELAGECGSGTEAIASLRRSPAPEVVFLDIEMPGGNGLEVIAGLAPEERPAIVFVTAHEQFAVDAFDLEAVDYLLKPFDRDRFRAALRRARERLRARAPDALRPAPTDSTTATPSTPAATPGADPAPERLTVRADGRLVFLKPAEVHWIEAADNYSILHLAAGRLMVRETLTALEERLGPRFVRLHRSALVHRDQLKEVQPGSHGDYIVVLRNGAKVPLSRSLRGQVAQLFEGFGGAERRPSGNSPPLGGS